MVRIQVAMSIGVFIPAPDGYEDMTDDEIASSVLSTCHGVTEYTDARDHLAMAAAYHRDSYPESEIMFTPALGNIDGTLVATSDEEQE